MPNNQICDLFSSHYTKITWILTSLASVFTRTRTHWSDLIYPTDWLTDWLRFRGNGTKPFDEETHEDRRMGNGMEQRRGGLGTREGDTSGEQGGIGRLERTDGRPESRGTKAPSSERTNGGRRSERPLRWSRPAMWLRGGRIWYTVLWEDRLKLLRAEGYPIPSH